MVGANKVTVALSDRVDRVDRVDLGASLGRVESLGLALGRVRLEPLCPWGRELAGETACGPRPRSDRRGQGR
jgi:hypothetical protein